MARNPRCRSKAAAQLVRQWPGQPRWLLCVMSAILLLNITYGNAQEIAQTGVGISDPVQIAQLGVKASSLPRKRAKITKVPGKEALLTPKPSSEVPSTGTTTGDASTPVVLVDKPRQRSAAAAARMAAIWAAQGSDNDATTGVIPMAMDPKYQTILDKHNTYRSWHQVGPLAWDDNLASAAATYAAGCNFAHDPNAQAAHIGENLWAIPTVGDVAGALSRAIDDWYNEVSKYNFRTPGFSSATGHFTQVVWKGTSLLGCGVASCNRLGGTSWAQGGTLVVCRYSPAGNYEGQFGDNVFQRAGGTPIPPATLPAGYRFQSPGCLYSVGKRFRMCMQDDGQVVVIDAGTSWYPYPSIIWTTTAPATPNAPYKLTLQADGNLVASDVAGTVPWSTGAPGRGTRPYKMVVQDNGNVVVSDSANQQLWATNTIRA